MSRTVLPDLKAQATRLDLPLPVLRDDVVDLYTHVYADYDKTGDRDSHDYYAGSIDAYATVLRMLGLDVTEDKPSEDPGVTEEHLVRLDDITTDAPVTATRLVCEYQMMGDYAGFGWAHMVLGEAKRQGRILDYAVLDSNVGIWGIQLVQFSVDVDVTIPGFGGTFPEAKEAGTDLVNSIVGDSDAEVRFVSAVNR